MDEQRLVAEFVDRHDLSVEPEYRLLDLVSEVGEVAKAINESTGYGTAEDLHIPPDELGDVLFALLALFEAVEGDAAAALETALRKYETRIDETGDAASG